ncbi:MAG: hypothetical protein H6737_16075 [Alphaproteobacteria bacterium]|nr:hypothetical protein [Alphaproteobacteria bacterium]
MSSRDTCTFAISRDGKHLAVGDGPEVLVYRGDGQPAWKHFCDGIIVGLAFVGAHLAVVDAEGNVVFFSAPDGRRVEALRIEWTCLGACHSPDGAFAVITADGLVFCESNGAQRPIPLRDLAVASFGPDRNSIALADRHGNLTAMDANTGAPWGSLALGAPVGSVQWCYQGHWVVAMGSSVLRIDGGATTLMGRTDLPKPVSQVTLSSDGAIAAALMPPENVGIIEMHAHRYVGDVIFRRAVHGVEFGRQALLGVGFDDGDANTVDLMTRATARTEPHPGRGRNNWNLDMQFEAAPLRGAVTYLRAGGAPIAEFHGYAEDEAGEGGSRNTGCKIALLIFFMFFLGLTGCLSFLFVMRWFGYL